MRASVDTNVLVRLVTEDDVEQAKAAKEHLESKEVYLTKTVLLETEWVLRYAYDLSRQRIADVFRKVLGLENLVVETPGDVLGALEWYDRGLDLAEALHLASSRSCDHFVTFDRKLAGAAEKLGSVPEVVLL